MQERSEAKRRATTATAAGFDEGRVLQQMFQDIGRNVSALDVMS